MNIYDSVDSSSHQQNKILLGPQVSHMPIKIINLCWGFYCVLRRHVEKKDISCLCPNSSLIMLEFLRFSETHPMSSSSEYRRCVRVCRKLYTFCLSTENVDGKGGSVEGVTRKCCCFETFYAPSFSLGSVSVFLQKHKVMVRSSW